MTLTGHLRRKWHRLARRAAAAPVLAATAWMAPAHGAGGHFTVDDAALLDPGQCQLEVWRAAGTAGRQALLHAGPACRVGGVEVGLNVDHSGPGSGGAATLAGVQIKWARALTTTLAAGITVDADWQDAGPRGSGSGLLAVMTWQPGTQLQVHVNAGRGYRRGDAANVRAGLGLQWAPPGDWSLLAERFREDRANFWRTGVRWTPAPAWTVDLSRASGAGTAWWTLGLAVVWR